MSTRSPSDARARSHTDLYADVTARIVAAIEAGRATYALPWRAVAGLPRNIVSGRSYRGINTVLLWLAAHARGYGAPDWATFGQWRDRGCLVRKGEKATTVVFWRQAASGAEPAQADATTERDIPTQRPFLARAYPVFNCAQVEGWTPPQSPALPESARDAAAEAFFTALPLTVHHGGDQAYYRPATDTIHLPPFAQFTDANAYYAVRSHESVHATGAPHRLDRDLSGRFGAQAYAMEELVAELGAAFLCAALGVSPEPRPDHAGYIQSWLKVLSRDTRAIFTAAGRAQAAADWLVSANGEPGPTAIIRDPPSISAAIIGSTDHLPPIRQIRPVAAGASL